MSACAAFGCKNRPQNKIPGITFHRFPKNIALRNEWLLVLRRVNFQPTKYSRLCSEHFSEDQIDRTSLACVRLRENAVPNIFKGYPKHLQKKLKCLSSTENKNMEKLKRKCIVEEEDENSMNDEGLEDHEEIITHLDAVEQINGCDNYSSVSINKNKRSCHPNILRIFPANMPNDVPVSKLSQSNLNPDLIDELTSSCLVKDTSIAPNSGLTTTPTVLPQPNLASEVVLKRKVQELEIMNLSYRKKIKLLQQQNRRQKAKIDVLKNRIKDLETNRTTDEDISEDLVSENELYEELLKHQMGYNENSS